jgi:hypothetical protein
MLDFDLDQTERLHKLLQAIDEDLRNYLRNPDGIHPEYFEDVHHALTEVMELCGVEATEEDENV